MTRALDPRGHRLTHANPQAIDACIAGIEGYNTWRADAIGHLDTAIKADEGFALPRIAKAWILYMARSAAYMPKIQQLANQAEACIDPSVARDRVLLDSLQAASAGDGFHY